MVSDAVNAGHENNLFVGATVVVEVVAAAILGFLILDELADGVSTL